MFSIVEVLVGAFELGKVVVIVEVVVINVVVVVVVALVVVVVDVVEVVDVVVGTEMFGKFLRNVSTFFTHQVTRG